MTVSRWVAVGRALTGVERSRFTEATAGTTLAGAAPGDVLAILADADLNLPVTENWLHLDQVAAGLPAWLPEDQRRPVVLAALTAATIIGSGSLHIDEDTPHPHAGQVADLAARTCTILHRGDEHA